MLIKSTVAFAAGH